MYAVIKTGGKQYRVSSGEKLKVERLSAEVGSQVTLEQVLMVTDGDRVAIGTPLVQGASIQATVVSHGRADKVRWFKLRRRKASKRQGGHRQDFTEIQIDKISG